MGELHTNWKENEKSLVAAMLLIVSVFGGAQRAVAIAG
jgi:hypothetical protein